MEKKEQSVESEKTSTDKLEEIGISLELQDKMAEVVEDMQAELESAKEKHLRLYAEFENYKKKVQKDKEEVIEYCNESLVYELLPTLDNLEMALRHSTGENIDAKSFVTGVENTFRELNRTLENFGLSPIEALGKSFDPSYHHAMTQVEKEDLDNNTVVEEFRKGYIYKEKVLRPSLVAVSKKVENSE